MSAVDETLIRSALLDCYDLELPCNIVDLGLVEEVTLSEDPDAPGAGIPGVAPRYTVAVAVTPMHPDEAAEAHLRAQIMNRLAGIEDIHKVQVEIRRGGKWNPHRISARGRRALGLSGNPNLVQISSR